MRRLIGKFFKAVFLLLNAYFVMIGVLATILLFVLMSSMTHFGDYLAMPSLQTGDRFVLVVKLDGTITEEAQAWRRFRPKDQISMHEMRKLRDLIVEDPHIEAVFLDINAVQGSFTTISELRSIFADLVKNGKRLVSYMKSGDNSGYFLASAGEQIIVPPAASIMIPGPVFNLVYLGKMLKNFGVGVEVLRSGKHKNVFEFLQRDSPSNSAVQVYADLEADLRDQMASAIAESREIYPAVVEQWLRRSLYTPEAAADAGIIDAIDHPSDALNELMMTVEVDQHIDHTDYLRSQRRTQPKPVLGIGYIEAFGQIVMSGNAWQDIVPENITAELNWMRDNDDVKAVVLRVDSGGGSALASELIWHELHSLSEVKPVVVTMGEHAASGGYYIAVGADYLFAEAGTITGSIGVAALNVNLAEFSDKHGISFHTITQTERENMLNFGRSLSADDHEFLQASLLDTYNLFVERVSSQRDLPLEKIKELADGRVFTGEHAYALGLVDAVGGIVKAFNKASVLAGFAEDSPYRVHRYPRRYSVLACIRETWDVRNCLAALQSKGITDRLLALAKDRVVAVWLGSLLPITF